MTWTQTASGKPFDLIEPLEEQINIDDIAISLSNTCRFNGHLKWAANHSRVQHYSVAEHSYWVSRYVPQEIALEGLLHDAAEAYIGDISRPLKELIHDAIAPIENEINRVIRRKFKLTTAGDRIIKDIDYRIL